ncbi:hypothetical protein LTR17_000528 [Elasticomyces elasticus]|nr:hypothetical protein LTR17_000528 [Elasticomyces elasticus]
MSLERARELHKKGYHAEATEEIASLHDCDGDRAKHLMLLADILITQGYVNRARDLLTIHGRQVENPDHASWALDMLRYFTTAVASGKIWSSIAEADKTYIDAKPFLSAEPISRDALVIELFYYKLVALCATFKPVEYRDHLIEVNDHIDPILASLVASKEFDDALKVIHVLQDEQQKRCHLEALLNMEGVTLLTRARAQVELASMLRAPEQKQQGTDLRELAYSALAAEHAYGALELDFQTCWESIMDGESLGDSQLFVLVDRFRKLDCPNALRSVLHKSLDVALRLQDFDLQQSTERELRKLSEDTGTTLFWITGHVTHVSGYHLRSGYRDLVKNTILESYTELTQYRLPMTQGQAAYLLADIYIQQGDARGARHWASVCENEWNQCAEVTSSIGRLQKLRSEILVSSLQEASEAAEAAALQSLCDVHVDRDLSSGLYAEAIQKLEIMLSHYHTNKTASRDTRLQRVQSLISRINLILSENTWTGSSLVKANSLQQQATYLISLGSYQTHCYFEYEAIRTLEQALQTFFDGHNRMPSHALITTRMQLGITRFALFRKLSEADAKRHALAAAEEDFAACVPGWEALSISHQRTEAKYWIALVRYEARIRGWMTSTETLHSLLEAESGFDDRRKEISVSTELTAVEDKQHLAKDKHVRDIYRFAVQVCILDRDSVQAWDWIQKAKARSLSDMLGLGSLVPETLRADIENDDEARKLYEKEKTITQQIARSTEFQRFGLRLQLRDLQDQMIALPNLRTLLHLRYGGATNASQLANRCSHALPRYMNRLVFVDWYVKGQEVFVFILRIGDDPVMQQLDISVDRIESWLARYMYTAEGRADFLERGEGHPKQALRELDCLIRPLEDATKQGDTLVLSPTAPLDKVPLHALHISRVLSKGPPRRVALIERNPVVYCSNMTTFIQCCERAAAKLTTMPSTSVFMAVYEAIDGHDLDVEEQETIYTATIESASKMYGTSLIGSQVTRTALEHTWQTADYIHFHGHCLMKPEAITDQALVLTAASNIPSTGAHLEPVLETVREVFSLKLRAPHISLMACEASSQRIEAGDEPLGLVTALLCAGAASVTGTMWPIASASARAFAAHFDEEVMSSVVQARVSPKIILGENSDEPKVVQAVVDLAAAFQQTVIRMKRAPRTRLPYHWAAFVIHGSCFMKYSAPSVLEQ